MPLATRISARGDELKLKVSGAFNYLVATECLKLYNWAPKGTLKRVVFELNETDSIDAYGEELLILLLERIRSRGTELVVENCPPHLGRIFDSVEPTLPLSPRHYAASPPSW
jgi:anti-anti-sigma regulatory factor